VNLTLIVVVMGLVAGVVALAVSASRAIEVDPIDPAVEERAVVRCLARRPRLARFIRQHFDRQSVGGFLITVSFIVLFVCALVVGVLLDMVDRGSGLAELDESISEWGSENATSAAVDVLKAITELGSTSVIIVVLIVVAVIDFVRRRNVEVFAFVAAVGIGQLLLNNGLKVLVERERPNVGRLVEASGFSFPSGHSAAAAATWSAVALVLGRDRSPTTRAVLAAAAALIAGAVATSRALLGVHWLTDIIAGLIVGWGWFVLVAVVFGGRAQRLGDPVDSRPRGVRSTPERTP